MLLAVENFRNGLTPLGGDGLGRNKAVPVTLAVELAPQQAAQHGILYRTGYGVFFLRIAFPLSFW